MSHLIVKSVKEIENGVFVLNARANNVQPYDWREIIVNDLQTLIDYVKDGSMVLRNTSRIAKSINDQIDVQPKNGGIVRAEKKKKRR